MQQVNLEQAQTLLAELIDAALHGEEVVITNDSQALVKLVPIAPASPRPQFGSAKGLITLAVDFDEPLEDFRV